METGGHRYENTIFRVLAPEENYAIVGNYMRRLPAMARPLAYRLGLDVRGPEDNAACIASPADGGLRPAGDIAGTRS